MRPCICAAVPILLVMRLLLAADGSEPSRAAVGLVAEMALPAGSVVRVLSVAPEPGLGGEFGAVGYERLTEELCRQARSIVKDAAAALGGLPRVEIAVRVGEPQREIVAEAQAWGAHLIVMGSHGRTGLRRLLMGSVAEYVMRHAPCPVEIVREPPPSEAFAPSG